MTDKAQTALSIFTDKQLKAELERRQQVEIEANKPAQLDNPDLSVLRKTCQEYIDCLASGDYCDEDIGHYIYEAAMEMLYGPDVWEFVNYPRGRGNEAFKKTATG